MKVIHICRKPLSEPTVAVNVQKHGTGGINIAACRLGLAGMETHSTPATADIGTRGVYQPATWDGKNRYQMERAVRGENPRYNTDGRWPANLILQHLPKCQAAGDCAPGCPVAALGKEARYFKQVGRAGDNK